MATTPRINMFTQIRAFYSRVFDDDIPLRPTHVSLYFFLLNQNNRVNWTEWFKCPFDTGMAGALINSNKTYYSVLEDLYKWKFIDYRKGKNNYKAPQISIIPLKNTDSYDIPKADTDIDISVINTQLSTLLSTQLTTQASTQLITQLTTLVSSNKDILNTSNFNIIIQRDNKPPQFLEKTKVINWELINSPQKLHVKLIKNGDFKSNEITLAKLEYELNQFRDYYQGEGNYKEDWEAVFRKWLRSSLNSVKDESKSITSKGINYDTDYD